MHINTEEMMRAACIYRDAADKMEKAAERIEEAQRRLSIMLEDGYGSNALKLIELLERLPEPPKEI